MDMPINVMASESEKEKVSVCRDKMACESGGEMQLGTLEESPPSSGCAVFLLF